MTETGAKNIWVCETCGHMIVCVHRDAGTTPMFLSCKDRGCDCDGFAASMMYRLGELETMEPQFEWYKPTSLELQLLNPTMRDHAERGGLLIRPIETKKQKYFQAIREALRDIRAAKDDIRNEMPPGPSITRLVSALILLERAQENLNGALEPGQRMEDDK